jgi:hypothetical protein
MICKEISVGNLLKHVFRGWFGIAKISWERRYFQELGGNHGV